MRINIEFVCDGDTQNHRKKNMWRERERKKNKNINSISIFLNSRDIKIIWFICKSTTYTEPFLFSGSLSHHFGQNNQRTSKQKERKMNISSSPPDRTTIQKGGNQSEKNSTHHITHNNTSISTTQKSIKWLNSSTGLFSTFMLYSVVACCCCSLRSVPSRYISVLFPQQDGFFSMTLLSLALKYQFSAVFEWHNICFLFISAQNIIMFVCTYL